MQINPNHTLDFYYMYLKNQKANPDSDWLSV